jgi:hypothetical protein
MRRCNPLSNGKRYRREVMVRRIHCEIAAVICPAGAVGDFVSSPSAKNFSLCRLVETAIEKFIPPDKGAFRDRHERGTGCGGRRRRF